ncbi:unnamed protein product [Brassica napus]|uniref:(rape) hypothetical protein n=1 Tax=Brassica napus TaxID=3708 RepID=A0A816PYT8_BRANA|nr:unnamed protein product [Brassica napus]
MENGFILITKRWGRSISIFPASQSLPLGRSNHATVRNRESSGGGPIGASQVVVESQGSVQMPTSSPLPIAQPTWCLMRSRPIKMPLQPWEQLDGGVT